MAELVTIDPIDKSADVISLLEDALRKARAGNVSSVAVLYVYRDGSTGQSWSFQQLAGLMVGCATVFIAKLVDDMRSRTAPDDPQPEAS